MSEPISLPDDEQPKTEPVADILAGLKAEQQRRDEQAKKAHEAKMQEWRDQGIVGLINLSSLGPTLFLQGPDQHGSVSLYAMKDGTVRWKKA